MMTAEQLSAAAQELELYFNNIEAYAKPAWIAIGKAHKHPGTFSYDRALKYLENRMRTAAKSYVYENCSMADHYSRIFPMSDRKAAAESVLQSMLAEFRLGNYWGVK